MIIPKNSTLSLFGEQYYCSGVGLRMQRLLYRIRLTCIRFLAYKGIKTYPQFSRLMHEYIGFLDPVDLWDYWEGVTFKEQMNDYVSHVIMVANEQAYKNITRLQ